jgi:hypothetical protein
MARLVVDHTLLLVTASFFQDYECQRATRTRYRYSIAAMAQYQYVQ